MITKKFISNAGLVLLLLLLLLLLLQQVHVFVHMAIHAEADSITAVNCNS